MIKILIPPSGTGSTAVSAATRTIALSGAGIQYLEICRAAAPVNLVLADGTTGTLTGGSAVLAAPRAGLTIWWSARSTGGGAPV